MSFKGEFEEKKENEVSYDIYERAINLPSYHDMTEADVQRVCALIRKFLKNGNE